MVTLKCKMKNEEEPSSKKIAAILDDLDGYGVHLDFVEDGIGRYYIGYYDIFNMPLEIIEGVGVFGDDQWHYIIKGKEKEAKKHYFQIECDAFLAENTADDQMEDFATAVMELERYDIFIQLLEKLHKNSLAYKSITLDSNGSYCSLETAKQRYKEHEKEYEKMILIKE